MTQGNHHILLRSSATHVVLWLVRSADRILRKCCREPKSTGGEQAKQFESHVSLIPFFAFSTSGIMIKAINTSMPFR
jgi:hypothetical protein